MTPFTAATIVARAIAADPAVVERLAALHPAFKKLRNPVLRRTMARLVTLGDAAKIAGVSLEALLAVANGEAVEAAPVRAPSDDAAPAWVVAADETAASRLDVRPILARGGEPLSAIMRAAGAVAAGGILILDAPFDPAPLRRVLGNKGFSAHAMCLAADHWRVYFRREDTPVAAAEPATISSGGRRWRAADGMHIDVRGLAPPLPMLAILKLIESGEAGDSLVVHHEREPIFLYPELDERGWNHALEAGDPGEVRLRLTREAA